MPGQLRLTLAEEPAAAAVPRVRNAAAALYEAGSFTRRTIGWRASTTSANQAILANLTTLRDRSRAATRNDGYAKGVIDKLVTNIIGTGVQPLSQADDPAFRKQIQGLWLRWTDESDADGLLDWYGQQAQAVRTWLEGGEAFIRLRPRIPADGLSVPLQIQVLEPELCPHTHNVFSSSARIRAGIEFNGIGRRVAYWFHPSRPELDDYDASQLRRVPADGVMHLYDPLRPGQLRGLPHLTQALIALYELDKYDDATLLRQQLANLFVAFLERPQSIGAAETQHPLTGQTVETFDEKAMLTLEAGIFQELEPGEKVTFSDPPEARGYPDFMRQQLFGVAAATGVPYEVLTGDMRGINDRTVRVILNEFRRRVQMFQHQIVVFQLCRPVWRAWMDRVFLSGVLPIPMEYLANPEPWASVRWNPHGWPYFHPVQDVQAHKEAVRCGFESRSIVVSETGEDAEVIDAEQAADNERADNFGLRYDSDGRQALTAAAATPEPEPEPEPAPAPTPAEEAVA
jgi:lambda family phage portal protein